MLRRTRRHLQKAVSPQVSSFLREKTSQPQRFPLDEQKESAAEEFPIWAQFGRGPRKWARSPLFQSRLPVEEMALALQPHWSHPQEQGPRWEQQPSAPDWALPLV